MPAACLRGARPSRLTPPPPHTHTRPGRPAGRECTARSGRAASGRRGGGGADAPVIVVSFSMMIRIGIIIVRWSLFFVSSTIMIVSLISITVSLILVAGSSMIYTPIFCVGDGLNLVMRQAWATTIVAPESVGSVTT